MKKKIILAGIIIVIIFAGAMFGLKGGNKVEVETFDVVKGDISKFVEDIGTIKTKNDRILSSNAMGKIKTINFEAGEQAKKDDIIIEIDSEEIDLQIKGLEAQMQGLRASYNQAIDPSKIDQAQVKVNTAKLSLEETQRQVENNKKLYDEGGISYDAYQSSLNELKQKENSLSIAQSELALVKKGVSGDIKNQHEAQITQLAYQIKSLENKKEDYIIKAPFDAMIMDVKVKTGGMVQAGSEMVELGNRDYFIETDILASEVGRIKEGASVLIESDDLGIHDIKGKVEKVYPKAFSKISDLGIEQKRVKVEISLEDTTSLRPGYDVDVNITEAEAKNVLNIPENAVFELDGATHVFVIEDGAAKLRKIEVGIESDELVEVKSGLEVGEKVIVSPDKDIEEGMKVAEMVPGT